MADFKKYFYDLIIISDARFEQEIKCIKDNFKNVYTINIYGRDNNLKEIHHLTTLRDTLLPKLMSGEISVK